MARIDQTTSTQTPSPPASSSQAVPHRRPSLTPRSSRRQPSKSTEAKYLGVWILLFVGSCLEAADVLCCVKSPTAFQYTIVLVALLIPIFISVVGLACYRRESPFHVYLSHATFIQLALYIVTCSISAFASKPAIVAWIIAVQCAVVLFLLLGTRFEIFGVRSDRSVRAIRPWLLALFVFFVRVAWHYQSMSQEALTDATYIISATIPTSFACYICMIWITTAGFACPWTFWSPAVTQRTCMSCQWVSLLGIQALIGTIVGTVVATTVMMPNKAALLPVIAIAFALGGLAFTLFPGDSYWSELDEIVAEREAHEMQ